MIDININLKYRPLKKWQCMSLYPRAAAGDPVAFEQLLWSVSAMIKREAKKRLRYPWTIDELMSAGLYGFTKGVRNGRWNPTRGAWTTYAYYCITGPMLKMVMEGNDLIRIPECRRKKRLFNEVTCSLIPDIDGTNTGHEMDLEVKENLDKINRIIERLPGRDKYIFVSRTIEDMTLGSVGKALGLSKERVRQLYKRIVENIRDEMGVPRMEVRNEHMSRQPANQTANA